MVRQLIPFLWAALALSLLTSCTRELDQPSRLVITFPNANSNLAVSQNVSALATKWTLADPSSGADFNCFAVAVEAEDLSSGANLCKNLGDSVVAKPKIIFGTFAAGTTQSIEVPSGRRRMVSLIGFQTSDVTKCIDFKSTATGLSSSHFSAPFILSQKLVNLEPGDVELSMTVPSVVPVSGKFEDCSPLAFHSSDSSANLTLVSISPSIGLSAGGTTVSVIGSNFDATTTVEIGGNACTSPVITANLITCTTAAFAPATYDVVVTKGLEVATLTNAYTYSAPHAMSIADASVTENAGGNVTVSLSGPAMGVTTVDYSLSSGSAVSSIDFTPISGSLTIASGATSGNIALNNIVNDAIDEAAETFTVALTNVSANAFISDGSGLITITDDDPTPSLSVANVSIGEAGTSVDVTVTASGTSANAMTFSYATTDGTAVAPGDYTTTSGAGGMITAGSTSTVVTIPIAQDGTFEGSETFTLTISSPTNATIGTATATITITDDEAAPTLSIADISIAEGGGNVLVQINASHASSSALNFDYATSNATAVAGSDYTAQSASSAVGAGTTSIQVSIPIAQDSLDEVDETFNVTISNPSFGSIVDNSAIVTITDDDAAPSVQFALSSSSAGEAAGSHNVTATLSAASGQSVTVDYSVTGGTATGGGTDYTLASGTLTFTAGDTSEAVSVTIVDDVLYEGGETVVITLANAGNASLGGPSSHTLTITDNETPAVLTISEVDPWDFGNVTIGGQFENTFTLTNIGGVLASSIIGNGLAAPYSFKGGSWPGTGGTCSTTLSSAGSCTFVVVINPGGAGVVSDSINVDYNDGAGMQFVQRDVTATGVNPASLSISTPVEPGEFKDTLIFGTGTLELTLLNSGGSTATGLTGTGLAAPFSFVGGSFPGTGGTCGGTLAAAASCTVMVQFDPVVLGVQLETVTFPYNDGAAAQSLDFDLEALGYRRVIYALAPINDVVLMYEQQPNGSLTSLGTQAVSSSPQQLTASPNGKHLYVARNSDLAIQSFTIASAGTLSSLATTGSHSALPSTMIFDPLARWLIYGLDVLSITNFYVNTYTLASGAISAASGSPFTIGDRIGKPAFHPTLDVLFVPDANNDEVRSYTVSGIGTPSYQGSTPNTGLPMATSANIVAMDPTGTYVYVATPAVEMIKQYQFSPTGTPAYFTFGQAAATTPTGGTVAIHEMLIHPTMPKIYALTSLVGTSDHIDLFTYNPIDGNQGSTPHTSTSLGNIQSTGMAMDPDGLYIYASDCVNTRIKVYEISPGSGFLNFQADFNAPAGHCPKKIISVKIVE